MQTGWIHVFPEPLKKVVAFGIFRASIPGRPDFEALVPSERSHMNKFVMPFDNRAGFTTSVALMNGSSLNSSEIQVEILNDKGIVVATYRERLQQLQHVAFETPVRWPATAGIMGSIRLTGISMRDTFAGLALLFNPTGSVTTAPFVEVY